MAKFETKLEMLLQNYLSDNGFTVDVRVDNNLDWFYDSDFRFINATMRRDPVVDGWFREVCDELGLEWNCPMFLLSMLHELGHDETIDDFTEFEWDLSSIYVALKGVMVEDDNITKESYMIYFRSPREIVATDWAVAYANEEKEGLRALWSEIIELFEEYIHG